MTSRRRSASVHPVALPEDYLSDALRHIAAQPRRPRQSILRRAVSAAYYAVFTELIADVGRATAPGAPAALQSAVLRLVHHNDVFKACKGWQSKQAPWANVLGGSVPALLPVLAADVVALQVARHKADYDPDHRLSKATAKLQVLRAKSCLLKWRALKRRHRAAANVFLVSLMHPTPKE
jgi:hypothetical protein